MSMVSLEVFTSNEALKHAELLLAMHASEIYTTIDPSVPASPFPVRHGIKQTPSSGVHSVVQNFATHSDPAYHDLYFCLLDPLLPAMYHHFPFGSLSASNPPLIVFSVTRTTRTSMFPAYIRACPVAVFWPQSEC